MYLYKYECIAEFEHTDCVPQVQCSVHHTPYTAYTVYRTPNTYSLHVVWSASGVRTCTCNVVRS